MVGKNRRLSKIFPHSDRRTIIVPVDDSLIFGPTNGLYDIESKIAAISRGGPDALLAHKGTFLHHSSHIMEKGWILNLSASTVKSKHTQKQLVTSVDTALLLDVQAVAVHVNLTSRYESEMLVHLGNTIETAQRFDLPVMAIIYPRSESIDSDENYYKLKQENCESYTKLVCHCVRVAKDLGVDFIKTQFTGTKETFKQVVKCAAPLPVVIAGGAVVPIEVALETAYTAIGCGGAGVSYGRNVFSRINSEAMVAALRSIIHEEATPQEAVQKYLPNNEVELC